MLQTMMECDDGSADAGFVNLDVFELHQWFDWHVLMTSFPSHACVFVVFLFRTSIISFCVDRCWMFSLNFF